MPTNKSFLLYVLFLACSCKTIETSSIPGNYYKRYNENNINNFVVKLTLNKDGSFEYKDSWLEVNNKCQGSWVFVKPNRVILKCHEEPFPAIISSGYMNGKEMKIKVLSKNKIKVDRMVWKELNSTMKFHNTKEKFKKNSVYESAEFLQSR